MVSDEDGQKLNLVLEPPQNNTEGYGYSYGFSVELFNLLSTITFDVREGAEVTEEIEVLDTEPSGTGEYIHVNESIWKFNWVIQLKSGSYL